MRSERSELGVNMDIILYTTDSERERVTKSLSNGLTLSGALRGESSVIKPSFTIEHSNPSGFNYCFIDSFGRYYYITNITSVRTGLWRIDCAVDVLMSFKTEILNLEAIIEDMSLPEAETYMNGVQWQTSVKTKTDVINFPSGLLDDGEYILITSGGVAS